MILKALAAFAALFFASGAESPLEDVLTQHNDAARTGANLHETLLKPSNVNVDNFGNLFNISVDGFIYAQPLVVTGLTIKGKMHTVLFIATEHNTLYAFDADSGEQLWEKNYGPSMPTPSTYFVNVGGNSPYHDLNPEIGITATPVIDRDTQTIYFTSYTQEQVAVDPFITFHHYLHAVDLIDGSEKMHGPVEIEGCMNPAECFVPLQELQRPGLLLVKPEGAAGQVILTFGSHGDYQPYHGWVMSYQADDVTKRLGIWVTNSGNTPEANGAGIWQGGMAPALDQDGNFYLMTGNGFFDGSTSFAESFLRFSTARNTIAFQQSFTPCNQLSLDLSDDDVGSSGPLLLIDSRLTPQPHYVMGGGRRGRIYLLDKDHLGGQKPCVTGSCGPPNPQPQCDPQVPQEFQGVRSPAGETTHHIHGSPVFWISKQRGPVIYVWGENDHVRAYPLRRSGNAWRFQTFPAGKPPAWSIGEAMSPSQPWNPEISMMTGGMLSLSGNQDHDVILWATTPTNNDANARTSPGILRAYDANDLSKELWDSYQDLTRDDFGNYAKFTPATIANGKVYVPTFSGHVSVYGLRPRTAAAARHNLLRNGGFESGTTGWTAVPAERFGAEINYPFYGMKNGVLCTTQVFDAANTFDICTPSESPVPQDSIVSQIIVAPATGHYTLRALCGTNILPNNSWLQSGEVLLGVNVNGRRVAASRVAAMAGYQPYEIHFEANSGDRIEVFYSAPGVKTTGSVEINKLITSDAWAVIDEVELAGSEPERPRMVQNRRDPCAKNW